MVGPRWLIAGLMTALLLVPPAGVAIAAGTAIDPARLAVVVDIDGAIGPATASYVLRGIQAAREENAGAVVLRLDTPGGLDSAMRDIIRAILASPVPVLAFVGPSGARAASAGTYILYASAIAAMAPGTNLGAATPISLFGPPPLPPPPTDPAGDGTKAGHPAADALSTKAINDAAAYIRGLAAMHGRNADWAEMAVRQAVSLPSDAALRENVVDLIATDITDLLTKADGREVIVNGRPMRLKTRDLAMESIEPAWRDRLLELLTDPSIVYLLLLAGLFGVTFELSHPGVFAPGVIGIICLLVGGYGLNLLPIDYAGLALTLLGLGLMAAEAFVPAFGAFVLGGMTAFAIGSVMMFDTAGRPPMTLIAVATLACAALFGVVLALLLRARHRPLASGPATLIGLPARITGWAGYQGEVMVQGERWYARAAHPLQPGAAARVVGREGLTLLIEAVPAPRKEHV